MINPTQLRDLISRVLQEIPNGYSDDAVELLMMIAAHESKLGVHIRQVNGPALGIFQIEPATHDDTWENGDSCELNASLLGYDWECEHTSDKLEWDIRYQIFMARQRLFMKPEAIPSKSTPKDMARYCKEHWNTVLGKASASDYLHDYKYYC